MHLDIQDLLQLFGYGTPDPANNYTVTVEKGGYINEVTISFNEEGRAILVDISSKLKEDPSTTLKTRIDMLITLKNQAVAKEDFDTAIRYRDEIQELQGQLLRHVSEQVAKEQKGREKKGDPEPGNPRTDSAYSHALDEYEKAKRAGQEKYGWKGTPPKRDNSGDHANGRFA